MGAKDLVDSRLML